jgi:hypothetical protein
MTTKYELQLAEKTVLELFREALQEILIYSVPT